MVGARKSEKMGRPEADGSSPGFRSDLWPNIVKNKEKSVIISQ